MAHEHGKADTPKKEIGLDESFKILATQFFGEFSKIITDYEIINLPKKADLLVVETDKPITNYVRIFDYFKTFNIIEFKSAQDPFRLERDIPKILVYTGGIFLAEKEASLGNTTFTIVSSRKPVKLFKVYKKHIHKVKNGVYLLKILVHVPVYIVAANEVEYSPLLESGNCLQGGNLDRETALIKTFCTGRKKIHFLRSILHEVLKGNHHFSENLHFAYYLYRNEIRKIMEKEGVNMSIGIKNIQAWNDELGLKDAYIKEGIEQGIEQGIEKGDKGRQVKVALKLLKKGFNIEEIMDTTELSREEILKLRDKK